jgi:hypothetical protein
LRKERIVLRGKSVYIIEHMGVLLTIKRREYIWKKKRKAKNSPSFGFLS